MKHEINLYDEETELLKSIVSKIKNNNSEHHCVLMLKDLISYSSGKKYSLSGPKFNCLMETEAESTICSNQCDFCNENLLREEAQ